MSNRYKLIVVEGIPGSGKTSIARFIQALLEEAQAPNELYLEGDLDHPADYEGIAWMPGQELEAYMQQSGPRRALIEPYAWVDGADSFIAYRNLERDHHDAVPQEVINFLRNTMSTKFQLLTSTAAWRSSAGSPLLNWLPGTRKIMCLNAA